MVARVMRRGVSGEILEKEGEGRLIGACGKDETAKHRDMHVVREEGEGDRMREIKRGRG